MYDIHTLSNLRKITLRSFRRVQFLKVWKKKS
jgi:hypothetical protein